MNGHPLRARKGPSAARAVPHWIGLGAVDLNMLFRSPRAALRVIVVMTALVGTVIVAVEAAVISTKLYRRRPV